MEGERREGGMGGKRRDGGMGGERSEGGEEREGREGWEERKGREDRKVNLKIEFSVISMYFSSTPNTLLCDYVQSALVRLEIPVACLVLLGMIFVSSLSHLCMSVYFNIIFDRI